MADKKQNSCGCGCMPDIQKSEKENSATPNVAPKQEKNKSKK